MNLNSLRLSRSYLRLEMNEIFLSQEKDISSLLRKIDSLLETVQETPNLFYRHIPFKDYNPNLIYVVLDLEGKPLKVIGFLFFDRIIQVYIKEEQYSPQLDEIFLLILRIFRKMPIFVFSNYEIFYIHNELLNRLKQTHQKREWEFFEALPIINVQERGYESTEAALYSMNQEPIPDPLLRKGTTVDFRFQLNQFELILDHNKSCLQNTWIILEQRYLKKNLLQYPWRENKKLKTKLTKIQEE